MRKIFVSSVLIGLLAAVSGLLITGTASAQDTNPFIGIWEHEDEDQELYIEIEFEATAYYFTMEAGEEEQEEEGTYAYTDDGKITFTPAGGEAQEGTYRFENDGKTLILKRGEIEFILNYVEEEE